MRRLRIRDGADPTFGRCAQRSWWKHRHDTRHAGAVSPIGCSDLDLRAKRYSAPRSECVFRKSRHGFASWIHLEIDPETPDVRAVEITGSHDGVAPILPDRRAHAVLPPRRNAKPCRTVTAGAVAKTRPCAHPGISAAPRGDDGDETADEAVPKQGSTA